MKRRTSPTKRIAPGDGPARRTHRRQLVGVSTAVLAAGGALSAAGVAGTAAAASAHHATSKIVLTEQDWWGTQPQDGAFDWLFATYERTHPDVTIQRDIVPSSVLLTKFLSEAQSGTLPDIAVPDNPFMPELEATGKFAPLNSYIDKWGQWGDYVQATKTIVSDSSGKIYGIQIGTNDLLIFYNKNIFKEAGITTLPKTWDELYSDGQRIVSKVKGLTYGAISFGATAGCSGGWQFMPWLLSAGSTLSVKGMTAPGTVQALDFWVKMLKGGLATRSVLSQCQTTSLPWIEQGKVAMVEDGDWDLATLTKDHASWVGFIPFPVPSAGDTPKVPLGGEVWTIPQTNPASEQAAWNFLQWSQQPSILDEFDNRMDYLSLRKSVAAEQQRQTPALAPFIAELAGGQSRTQYLGANENAYSTDMSTAISQALLGEKPPLAALQAAQQALESSIKSS
jgi:multiple sugar transport system substrate-binding protein